MDSKKQKKPAKVVKEAATKRAAAKPVLLTGGNPQIAKAYGDAPVQAYIAAMPGWKSPARGGASMNSRSKSRIRRAGAQCVNYGAKAGREILPRRIIEI